MPPSYSAIGRLNLRRRPVFHNARENQDVFYNAQPGAGVADAAAAVIAGRRWLQLTRQRAAARQQAASVLGSMNKAWGTVPSNRLVQNRRRKAIERWKRAGNAARPSKVKLLQTVKLAYLTLDMAAQTQGFAGATRMIQENLGALITAYYAKFRTEVMAEGSRLYAAVRTVRQCARWVSGATLSYLPARAAAFVLLKGWAKACERSKALDEVSTLISSKIMASVDGGMKRAWTAMGTSAAWALPFVFDKIVKAKLSEWVARANPKLVPLIRFDVVTSALRRHQDTVGATLIGKNVDLLPVVLDVASALDSCVLQALLVNFLPKQRVALECTSAVGPLSAGTSVGSARTPGRTPSRTPSRTPNRTPNRTLSRTSSSGSTRVSRAGTPTSRLR